MIDKFSQVAENLPAADRDADRQYHVINGYPVVFSFSKEPNSEHPACHQLYEEGRLTSWTNAEPNAILSAVMGGATNRVIAGRSLTTK